MGFLPVILMGAYRCNTCIKSASYCVHLYLVFFSFQPGSSTASLCWSKSPSPNVVPRWAISTSLFRVCTFSFIVFSVDGDGRRDSTWGHAVRQGQRSPLHLHLFFPKLKPNQSPLKSGKVTQNSTYFLKKTLPDSRKRTIRVKRRRKAAQIMTKMQRQKWGSAWQSMAWALDLRYWTNYQNIRRRCPINLFQMVGLPFLIHRNRRRRM